MPRSRKSPKRNVPAADVVAFLDTHATISVDLDRTRRSYINGVWVDPVHKREITRTTRSCRTWSRRSRSTRI
jgi:hypothetical protein